MKKKMKGCLSVALVAALTCGSVFVREIGGATEVRAQESSVVQEVSLELEEEVVPEAPELIETPTPDAGGQSEDFVIEEGVLKEYKGKWMDVIIPETVTQIAPAVFAHCSSLFKVTLPKGITYIDHAVFLGCTNLETVNIPGGVTGISTMAFDGCSSLKNINLPASLTSIQGSAFNGCSSLESIVIPMSVEEIDDNAFEGCTNLTIHGYKNSVADIFAHENNIDFVEIGAVEECFEIENGVLIKYKGAGGDVVIPEGVAEIGDNAFVADNWEENTSLRSVLLPESVTGIGEQAFMSCVNLTQVTIESEKISIADRAFANCSNLTTFTVNGKVTSIGKDVFVDSKWLEIKRKENPLVIIDEILIDGQACSGAVVIPENITCIRAGVFEGCAGMTSLYIPDTVKNIEPCAFRGCTSLRNVIIPESITEIEWCTFEDCESLESIIIPENVTNIGVGAFDGTKWLEIERTKNPLVVVNGILIDGQTCSGEAVIPDGVTKINNGAFFSNEKITNVMIPGTVDEIGAQAFQGCDSLTNVTIPEGTVVIGDNAFADCWNLVKVTIPKSVTHIGNLAFNSGANLKTIEGYTGSCAETYAKKYNVEFISIGVIEESPSSSSKPVTPPSVEPEQIKDEAFYNVDGEDGVGLSDAQKILRYALLLDETEKTYTLGDAQKCLRIALLLDEI